MSPELTPQQLWIAYVVAHAERGSAQARGDAQSLFADLRAQPRWAALVAAAEELLAGSRDREALLAAERGLDAGGVAVLMLALDAIEDEAILARIEQTLTEHQSAATPQTQEPAPHLLQVAYNIVQAARGKEQGTTGARFLIDAMRDRPDWAAVAVAADEILAGSRDRAALLAPDRGLNQFGQIIIALVLDALSDPAALARMEAQVRRLWPDSAPPQPSTKPAKKSKRRK